MGLKPEDSRRYITLTRHLPAKKQRQHCKIDHEVHCLRSQEHENWEDHKHNSDNAKTELQIPIS